MKRLLRLICLLVVVGILFISQKSTAYAQNLESHIDSHLAGETETRTNINDAGTAQTPDELKELNISNDLTITYNNGNGELAGSLRILLTLTLIALAPLLLVMLTSFTRIIIVLHFTRSALNTSTAPPNNVLIGLALILTFFIMQGTLTKAYNEAVLPFDRGEITQAEAIEKVMNPFRDFMYGQTQTKDVRLFMEIADVEWDGALSSIPNYILVPSFVVSELRTAFIIGFIIYIPFVVIDMIVASVLMSMGMMMLPPTTISMPFKVLLFVLADGWNLIIGSLVKSFY
ncbi:flagellar biosynthetic protein FliP [Lachnospiraceae bacterium YSD2013]|nr:flagellar type III secretion system pore protein FliP [Lachnospiraceae bacterium]SCX08614.1 flagellar biosynthetic protein FliP [Lachnospiraceae bacterium YSD2013]